MKKLKCILIDDELRNLELLNYYIEKYCPDLQIEAIFSKGAIAEDYLKDESKCSVIDIIFLDLSFHSAKKYLSNFSWQSPSHALLKKTSH